MPQDHKEVQVQLEMLVQLDQQETEVELDYLVMMEQEGHKELVDSQDQQENKD